MLGGRINLKISSRKDAKFAKFGEIKMGAAVGRPGDIDKFCLRVKEKIKKQNKEILWQSR
jgi:hypothetical protein